MSAATRAQIRPWATSSPPASAAAISSRARSARPRSRRPCRPLALAAAGRAQAQNGTALHASREVAAGVDDKHHVAEGYDADVLIRWGDPVLPGAPAFDPRARPPPRRSCSSATTTTTSAISRCPARPIPSQHGLLVVNHEYTNEELMFPGLGRQDVKDVALRRHDEGPGRHRDGGAWRRGASRSSARTANGASSPDSQIRAPHRRRHADGDHRPGRRARPSARPRPIRPAAACSAWSTTAPAASRRGARGSPARRTSTAISGASSPTTIPRRRNYKRYGVPANCVSPGASCTTASTSPRSRTRRTGSAGSSRSTRSIRPRRRRSAPRSAAFKHEGAAGIVNRDGRYVVY